MSNEGSAAFSEPITTSRRAAINRENSQRSTGPRSENGRQRSSQNAVKHGLTSRAPVLSSEDADNYQRHCREFRDEYQPQTPTEAQLLQELADTAWRLNRIPLLEAQLLNVAGRHMRSNGRTPSSVAEATRALATLGMHSARLSRQFNKTLSTLREIQAERLKNAQPSPTHKPLDSQQNAAQNGFVFSARAAHTQTHASCDDTPVHAMHASTQSTGSIPALRRTNRPQ